MSDRDELTSVVAYALGWEWDEAPGVPSVADTLADVIDGIEEWMGARDARVKAEAWDEGARWAYEEITGEPENRFGLAPGDNPHRAQKGHNE